MFSDRHCHKQSLHLGRVPHDLKLAFINRLWFCLTNISLKVITEVVYIPGAAIVEESTICIQIIQCLIGPSQNSQWCSIQCGWCIRPISYYWLSLNAFIKIRIIHDIHLCLFSRVTTVLLNDKKSNSLISLHNHLWCVSYPSLQYIISFTMSSLCLMDIISYLCYISTYFYS